MFHFCHEELFAIMAAIPAAGFALNWLRSKLHRGRACDCPNAEGETPTPGAADPQGD